MNDTLRIPEQHTLIDWFAGAALDFDQTEPNPFEGIADWQGGQVSLGFTDIGTFGDDPRSQLVLYFQPFEDDAPGRAISVEVDRQDAIGIIAKLAAWIAEAEIPSLNDD